MSERINHQGEHESHHAERISSAEKRKPTEEIELLPQKQHEMLEAARKTAEQESITTKSIKAEAQPEAPLRITKHDKDRAYKQTMGLVQAGLGKPSRRFSRLVHQPAIAKVSEAAEKSVARPGAIMGAGLTATIGLALMLFFARHYGFSLSGSEFIVLLVVGWAIGLGVDLINSRFRQT